MKKIILFIVVIAVSSYTNAQVGIGTNVPTTDLDVVARTGLAPNEFNGLTIPRIAVLPTVAADIAPAGTLIYLTAVNGTNPIGFYFSTGTAYVNVASAASGAFVETAAPTVVATDRTTNITRTGRVSLGGTVTSGTLNVVESNTSTSGNQTGIKVENNNTGTANLPTNGIFIENNAANTGNKIGLRSDVSGAGIGTHIGLESNVTDANGTTTNFGVRSIVGATDNVGSTAYGIYSEIGTGSSRGTNYAVYGFSNHGTTSSDPSYSGYFRGDNFAIRSEDDAAGYNLPTTTGAVGQVLTTTAVTGGIATTGWRLQSPVQYSMWQGGLRDIFNLTTYTTLDGIQTIFDPSLIDSTNNVEIKLVIWVTDYASQTDFELQAFDVNRNGSIAITQGQLIYEGNASGGFITTNWIDYNAGTASPGNNNRFVQLFLRALITGMDSNAQISSVYVLVRPNQ